MRATVSVMLLAVLLAALAAGGVSCDCTYRTVVTGDDFWRPADGQPPDSKAGDARVDTRRLPDLFRGDGVNPAARDYIYVLDDQGILYRFNPLTYGFNTIGKLICGDYFTPNSMGVDRNAKAWVNFHSGEIYHVSTLSAWCGPSGYTSGQLGPDAFHSVGMGYVADSPYTTDEKLYVSEMKADSSPGRLGYLDPATLKINAVGWLPKAEVSPELTGTADGSLYGYFPGVKSSFVARLSKTTAQALQTWPLPGLGSQVNAWAFAHWGGWFFIFVTSGGNSRVLRFSTQTGKAVQVSGGLPFSILGAGVSARAPLTPPDGGLPPPSP